VLGAEATTVRGTTVNLAEPVVLTVTLATSSPESTPSASCTSTLVTVTLATDSPIFS
jgi:hypothetical protein